MLNSDNSLLRKKYLDSFFILNEYARILPQLQMDSFKAGIAGSYLLTSDIIMVQNVHAKG